MNTKYPDITDKNFYEKIDKIYNKYRVKKNKYTVDKICKPKEFQLQLPQKFLSHFINPKTQYKGVLVYHRIGSGKTCTAIQIAEKWIKHKRIIVVVPASLKTNFRNELRSLCASNKYLKNNERNMLKKLNPTDEKYREIIKKSDRKIDMNYEIYSYNKFVDLYNTKKLNLKNSLLIVDEIQNMISEKGTYYETIYKAIHTAPHDLRIVLLSATPMFDKPNELALLLNLLRLKKEIPISNEFNNKFILTKMTKSGKYKHEVKNIDLFKKYIKGYVSYFRGAPQVAFPHMTIKYIKCEMSDFQYSIYKKVLKNDSIVNTEKKKIMKNYLNIIDLPNNFYLGTRFVSNIVFPNKQIGSDGFDSLTDIKIKKQLSKYSCKFYKIIKKIEKCKGKIFVYSAFKNYGGIKSFIKILEAYGYKNYATHGSGRKRYALWSGDESITAKEELKSVYNLKENLNGSMIKILLGTVAIKEGVSLTAVKQVHIIEPYWNTSRLEQVIGRASRMCSHRDLSIEEQNVKVYIYIAIAPKSIEVKQEDTIDQYIQYIAKQKEKIVKSFEQAIKEAAIDCELNKNANSDGIDGINDIKCDV